MTINIENITKSFGNIRAVDNLSFDVFEGNVMGFLGPNGAGKSTTMRMLAGFITPTSGAAYVYGKNVVKEPIEAKRLIGYMPEGSPAYGEMSPLSFLRFIAEIRGLSGDDKKRAIARAIELASIEEVLDQPIETLSKGFNRRVGLAQALLHDPKILILDEPTEGLDPNQKHQVRELIKNISKDKIIIISTHILEEVEAICNRAIIIDKGRLAIDSSPEELVKMSATHNDVILKVKTSDLKKSEDALRSIIKVKEFSYQTIDDITKIVAKPDNAQFIADNIVSAFNKAKIKYSELGVEKGSLDDVFRKITTSDISTEQKV